MRGQDHQDSFEGIPCSKAPSTNYSPYVKPGHDVLAPFSFRYVQQRYSEPLVWVFHIALGLFLAEPQCPRRPPSSAKSPCSPRRESVVPYNGAQESVTFVFFSGVSLEFNLIM